MRRVNYTTSFEEIKNAFSKSFLKQYLKYEAFHDFQIVEVNVDIKESSVKLLLFDCYGDYGDDFLLELLFTNVKAFDLNVDFKERVQWDMCKFKLYENGCMKTEILCHNGSNIKITSKKIRLKQVADGIIK